MMFELLDYVAFAAALLTGLGVGRRMRPRPPEPLKPVCTCGHGYGHHENGQACAGVDVDQNYWYEGSRRQYHSEKCTCLHYDGPDPTIFGLETPK